MPIPDELKTEAAAVVKELDYLIRNNDRGATYVGGTLSEPLGRAIGLIGKLAEAAPKP